MGSYNYLGFGECSGPCTEAAESSIKECGVGSSSTRSETGLNLIILIIKLSFSVDLVGV